MPELQNATVPDPVDRRILSLLKSNARMSATALAQDVGLSRTALQARLRKLERDGTILGYTVVTSGLGRRKGTEAILNICIGKRPCAPVLARFKDWPEMLACYSTSGPVDAVAIVAVDDGPALSQLVDRLSAVAGVTRVESTVILGTVREMRSQG